MMIDKDINNNSLFFIIFTYEFMEVTLEFRSEVVAKVHLRARLSLRIIKEKYGGCPCILIRRDEKVYWTSSIEYNL